MNGDAHLHNAARVLERLLADRHPGYSWVVEVPKRDAADAEPVPRPEITAHEQSQ